MASPGPKNLITDVPGIKVGHAHDAAKKTGVTAIIPDKAARAACAVAGGGPGTRETDALKSGTLVEAVDGIVLSGGSVYGLAAADGVAASMGAEGRGFQLVPQEGVPPSPVIPSAILYDLANGGDKGWGDNPPYHDLGKQAYKVISDDFELGVVGAGYGAMAGSHKGGIGSASLKLSSGHMVGAIVAVNSFGSVYMPGTDTFWAAPYEQENEFGGQSLPQDHELNGEDWGDAKMNPGVRQNTTIACIATDMPLDQSSADRVAQMALAGFARAIRPVFAPFDGDSVFVLSTGEGDPPDPLSLSILGEAAAQVLARAIARGVYEAKKADALLV